MVEEATENFNRESAPCRRPQQPAIDFNFDRQQADSTSDR
jgi:hypothetical protein